MFVDEYRRDLLPLVRLACIATLFTIGSTQGALAAVPGEINFQGLLLDSGGLVVNGSVDLDFELFDAASAGTSLWSESHSNVSVLDGVYDLALGSITPIGAAVLASGSVWLEITVEGETLAPRQRLLAVPYSLRSAEADHATSADTAGNLPVGVLEAIYANFPFDGADPPNDDPSEGTADSDNDGLPNFIDSDNDNDGLSDSLEVAQGSNINVPTPAITSLTPPIASDILSTPVAVTGTQFVAGLTVQVDAQTPTPTNLTANSFDILLNAQPATSTNLIVTLANGQQASAGFDFALTVPSITSLAPSVVIASEAATIDVVGTDLLGAYTVTFDGSPVTPVSVTTTSFSIDIISPPSDGLAPIVVTLPNGQSASQSLLVTQEKLVFVTSTAYIGGLIGGLAGADALCASRAAAGGLQGTFLAWLGDSTGSPSTRFNQAVPFYRLPGNTVIANGFADLTDGAIENGISEDEFGSSLNVDVWSNVVTSGTSNLSWSCADWSSTSGLGRIGVGGQTDASWTYSTLDACSSGKHLYCFEQ